MRTIGGDTTTGGELAHGLLIELLPRLKVTILVREDREQIFQRSRRVADKAVMVAEGTNMLEERVGAPDVLIRLTVGIGHGRRC